MVVRRCRRDAPSDALAQHAGSGSELDRADRYHFAVDRNIYTAAHALARLMLSEATGLSTDVWRYTVGQFGKPALAADLSKWNLHHNISHTRGLATCAIATHDIGIDVERSDQTIDPGIARDYFAPEEINWILNPLRKAKSTASSSGSGR